MKKKILLTILIGGMTLGLTIGCGKKEDLNSPVVNTDKPLYEDSNLVLINSSSGDTEQFQGEVIDAAYTNGLTYVVTKDRKVYYRLINSYTYFTTLDENYSHIASELMCNNDLVIKNKDNSYTVYEYDNPKISYNLLQHNLICIYYTVGNVSTISLDNGILKGTSYNVNNNAKNEITIKVDESGARTTGRNNFYAGKYKNIYSGEGTLMAIREDGLTYSIILPAIINGEVDTNGNYGMIEEVDKIYNNNVTTSFESPIYSKNNDVNNIYIKSTFGDNIKKVTLPNGYTVNDIKTVQSADEILILMYDGTAFYNSVNGLIKIDSISKLLKEQKIVKILSNKSYIQVLCNDGYMYEFNK